MSRILDQFGTKVPLRDRRWSAFGRQPARNFRIAPTINAIRFKFEVHRGSK
jgi:hypothetical protein